MNNRLLIFILAALSMLGALSIDAYLPALLTIAGVFSVTPAAAQQTLTVYLIAFAFMTLFYGTLSDSFGRRPVLLLSMLLYVLSSIGAGLSTSLGMLILFRFFQGATAGAGSVIGRAIVGDLFTGAEAQRVMSYISVVFGLAPAIAPVLGGWLLASFGWRSIFGFIAAFSGLLLLLCARALRESLPPEKRHPFRFRPVLLNYLHVGSCATFMLQGLSIAFTFWGIIMYVGSAPAFVINILHLRETDYGWLFIPLIGGMTAGSWVAARCSHRFRASTMIGTGFAIMFVAAAANLAYALLVPAAIPWAIVGPMFYCFGMALATPAMTVRALEIFPRHRGLAASLQGFLFMALFAFGSGAVCPLLFGSAAKLAACVAMGVVLSAICWRAGTSVPPAHADEGFIEEDRSLEH
ncbi:MAG: multidrug effflux MFS transporter [Chthoniobacter sp.]|uniref:multidrug effflux MFS transporter n=1 Tax=Chthoniobacter sp. TaxID=2510640 RepID=UPI0032A46119